MGAGGGPSGADVAEGAGGCVAASSELKLKVIAVGDGGVLPRTLVEKIKQIPRIETMLITIGIRSARSNEERGCILGKVLPRF